MGTHSRIAPASSPVRVGLVLALATTACTRPPTTSSPTPTDEGRVEIPLDTFVQDRPAIGGKWYDYNVDGHILEPKDEAWVLRRGDRTSGFAITSIYDDDSGDSGVFSLVVSQFGGDGWSAPVAFTALTNVKDQDSVCVDIDDADGVHGGVAEVDCSGDDWDLRFAEQSRLSVFAGFAVTEPAVFLADGAVVARVDVSRSDDGSVDLAAALPAPNSLTALLDDDAPRFDNTDWDFSALAPNQPRAGLALGDVDRVAGHDIVMFDGGRGVVEFSLSQPSADVLRVHQRRVAVDNDTFTVPANAARGAFVDVDIDLTAASATTPVFLSFAAPGLLTPADDLVDVSVPVALPASRLYDILVFVEEDGATRLVLSPATAVSFTPLAEATAP